jgi:hypothetical protein
MPKSRIDGSPGVYGALTPVALAVLLSLCASPAVAEDVQSGSRDPAPVFLWSSFFVGTRSSQFGAGTEANLPLMPAGRPEAAVPADLYLGYEKKLDGVSLGAAALFVAQPAPLETGFASDAAQSSYWRFKAGASASLVEGMQLGVNVHYTPDAPAQVDGASYLNGPAQDFSVFARALAHNAAVNPGGCPSSVGVEDVKYDVSLSFRLPYESKVDLRYYKTLESPITACSGACPAFFAAALQTRF